MLKQEESSHVLPQKYGGGPHGVGDPNDRTLRKVEVEVLIPKIMRERAKVGQCQDLVKSFESCCKDSSLLMVVTCRKQNEELRGCLAQWYQDAAFKKECTEIYLKERSDFRSTGLQKKHRVYLEKRREAGLE